MMRKYDNEFKQQAVKKILDGQSVASLSRELGVGENQLHKWKKLKIESGSDLEKENLKLKKQLREVQMENEILKKAALIFGRGS
jgi:transposase